MANSALSRLRHLFDNLPAAATSPSTSSPLSSIDAFIVPSEDAHHSEYTPACDQRRAFISGFTGSAGLAAITRDHAALFTDGRYYLQAEAQLDSNWTLMKTGEPTTPSLEKWLCKEVKPGQAAAVDPTTITHRRFQQIERVLNKENKKLIPLNANLIDLVWEDRPPSPRSEVFPLALDYTGEPLAEKIKHIREVMAEEGCGALVVTALDEVAWLLNLRGSDVEFNPVFVSYVVVTPTACVLYADQSRFRDDVPSHLGKDVVVKPYEAFWDTAPQLINGHDGNIWLSNTSSHAVASLFPPEKLQIGISPVASAKGIKNDVELECLRRCHIKDAVALAEYFAWLEAEVGVRGKAIDEVTAADKLLEFRKQQEGFISESFATISSAGPNAAIIHYKPEPSTCRDITRNEIYLCDSGGQYLDGTTDVTRTMHFGTPTEREKECFTRVLKGHINLDMTTFPNGTSGRSLDPIARQPIWAAGLNYPHGTGHGVGCFLNVHEGPMGISFRASAESVALEKGMVVTNEPGYYEDGHFGMRVENVVEIVERRLHNNFNNVGFLGFVPMTLVPIQAKMIQAELLTEREIEWLDEYHTRCREVVGEELSKQGRMQALTWLENNTLPLSEALGI